jgi:hypothetical protein
MGARWRIGWALSWALVALAAPASRGQDRASPQSPGGGAGHGRSPLVNQLLRMSEPELLQLYRRGCVGPTPVGTVRGQPVVRPGTRLGPTLSRGARVIWQGKTFDPCDSSIVNKFFGLRMIRGAVSLGPSWLDGGPALIIDYSQTSHLYRNYRDEIRMVAPGVYLGLMYARTEPCPSFKTFFILETCMP